MTETKTWKDEAIDSINSGFFDDENSWRGLAYDFAISVEDCKEGTYSEVYNFIFKGRSSTTHHSCLCGESIPQDVIRCSLDSEGHICNNLTGKEWKCPKCGKGKIYQIKGERHD